MTSNILGLGHDLIEIARIQNVLERFGSSFLERIFTTHEQQYCLARKTSIQSLAARFAAKEAVAKALGCGIGAKLGWHDVEITSDDSGKPLCTLSPKVLKIFGPVQVHITLTHTHIYASAVALAMSS